METKVVHCKLEDFDIYIGRPSKWGNPFSHISQGKNLAKHIVSSRAEAIESFRKWITSGDGKHLLKSLHELKGKVLGCWCSPLPCHGEVLIDLVKEYCKSENHEPIVEETNDDDFSYPSSMNCARPDGDCSECDSYDEDENLCSQDDDLGCTGHGDDSFSDSDF